MKPIIRDAALEGIQTWKNAVERLKRSNPGATKNSWAGKQIARLTQAVKEAQDALKEEEE